MPTSGNMNMQITAAIQRLTDSELQRLCLAHSRGYMLLPPEPADDLVHVYTALCLLEKRPALFLKASPPSGVARIIVAVHAPQLLPGLIQTAMEAGVAIRRVMPINAIFTGSVTADRALAVARMLSESAPLWSHVQLPEVRRHPAIVAARNERCDPSVISANIRSNVYGSGGGHGRDWTTGAESGKTEGLEAKDVQRS